MWMILFLSISITQPLVLASYYGKAWKDPGILTDEVKWDDYGVKGSPLQHSNRTDLDRTLS